MLFLWLTSFWNNESESEPCCIIVQVKTCLQLYCGYLLTPQEPSKHGFSLEIQPFAVSIPPSTCFLYGFFFPPKVPQKANEKLKFTKGFAMSSENVNLWCPPVVFFFFFFNLNAFCVVTFGVSPSVEALPGGRSVITFFASPRPCFCFDFLNFPQWRHVSLRRQSSRFNAVPNPLKEWGHAAYLRNTNTRIPLKKAIPSKKITLIFLKTFVLNVRHQIFRMNPFTVFFFWCATFRVI